MQQQTFTIGFRRETPDVVSTSHLGFRVQFMLLSFAFEQYQRKRLAQLATLKNPPPFIYCVIGQEIANKVRAFKFN